MCWHGGGVSGCCCCCISEKKLITEPKVCMLDGFLSGHLRMVRAIEYAKFSKLLIAKDLT
jgi:hypothetical protein